MMNYLKVIIMKRDDFPKTIKETVAKRAAFICSNPDCRKNTVWPHSNPEKSSNSGVAAHICAAATGGPRYDPQQTPEERGSIKNAIWLCHNCSDKVDKDEEKYSKEVLIDWKGRHEEFILQEGIPSLPDIRLHTLDGFTIPVVGNFKITGEHCTLYREHVLIILNNSDKILHNIHLRIQFPEIIIHTTLKKPVGVNIVCLPDQVEMVARASGSGSVTVTQTPRGCENYIVEIDKFLPGNPIEVKLLSIEKDKRLLDISEKIDKEDNNFKEYLHFYIRGSFQYELQNSYHKKEFLVPLIYNREQRLISSLACEDFVGDRKLCYSYVM